jgi:hypothetical protein
MRVELPIHSWAVAGCGEGFALPEGRVCPLPPEGFHPRKARLPGLAKALATAALEGGEALESTSVLFGTALGCLTETAAFVENMIERGGVAPRPRAFTASVHNAIASEVARALGARGECQTFVHGEVSMVQALFAAARQVQRGGGGEILVGAVDEWTPYVERGLLACAPGTPLEPSEGGAVLRCSARRGEALVLLRAVGFGRPRDPRAWLDAQLEGLSVDAVLVPGDDGSASRVGTHPSASAVMTALAVGILSGEVEPAALGIDGNLRRIVIMSTTRFGDRGLVVLESVR